jgi:hypothetical protein
VDETTNIFNKFQLALIFHYEFKETPVERFWGFFNLTEHDADSLTQTILNEIDSIIEKKILKNSWYKHMTELQL